MSVRAIPALRRIRLPVQTEPGSLRHGSAGRDIESLRATPWPVCATQRARRASPRDAAAAIGAEPIPSGARLQRRRIRPGSAAVRGVAARRVTDAGSATGMPIAEILRNTVPDGLQPHSRGVSE